MRLINMKILIVSLFIVGCTPNYPRGGNFGIVEPAEFDMQDIPYESFTVYRFVSHVKYFISEEGTYPELVKELISKLLKDRNMCAQGFIVPDSKIGGYEGGHIEALVVCRKAKQ